MKSSATSNAEADAFSIRETTDRCTTKNYARFPIAFTHGNGSRLWDEEGREYLDLFAGLAVSSLGHAHPGLARAIGEQAATLLHTSNLFHHPLQAELATRLSELSGLPRAFFCNSGAEAVEACLKFARRFWHAQGTPRTRFVAFDHSFHGRTMGAVSVTWDAHYRDPFGPLVRRPLTDVAYADRWAQPWRA